MRKDPALAKAVDVVSVHYPREKGKLTTPADAVDAGKPLWSSEDQPESSASIILSRDWAIGGRSLAHLYNENYLEGHFTKTEIWSPVTSYYDILAAPNSGLMYANTPWSGHYDVQGAIWATAHTTQFADARLALPAERLRTTRPRQLRHTRRAQWPRLEHGRRNHQQQAAH